MEDTARVKLTSTEWDSSNKTTMVLPVLVSHKDNSEFEITVYAMLDTQSDSTFISTNTCEKLNVSGPETDLLLSTLSSEHELTHSSKISGLRVRGIVSNKSIDIPLAYTRDIMPMDRSHIPTSATAMEWPHLQHIAHELPPLMDCDVGLLIGYNCPQALTPREVIAHESHGPFGQRTDLGWGIVGLTRPVQVDGDIIGVSHRVMTAEDPTSERKVQGNSIIVLRSSVKEVFQPMHAAKLLELDFNETANGDPTKLSFDDQNFLKTISQGIHMAENGHLEMPLPFKSQSLNLPANRSAAEKRLGQLARRFERSPKYQEDYTKFMANIIEKGHAELVPSGEIPAQPAWYIPHHGVYHPKKPDKLRVVFDCSAKYHGESLNDHLLQGPDLTNTLIGVLCRFRRHPVALMCDIESMFHQFFINAEHRNYLRFLWWENGHTEKEPQAFRMKVHLFGAASSPACCNFGLKHLASMHTESCSTKVTEFLQHDFYVDDGLTSVPDSAEALQLIDGSTKVLECGGICLHKFLSNSKEVMKALPDEDKALKARDLDLRRDALPVERALGMAWDVESDTFKFEVSMSSRQPTRRIILSAVSAVFNPMGLVSPVILRGKLILQNLCRSGALWDEAVSDSISTEWENWRDNLAGLSHIQIARCYRGSLSGNIVKSEVHHFSDASSVGYGQCSYLRQVDLEGKTHCYLVMSKARVAPIKPQTIPGLELAAAVTSARISALLRRELNIEYTEHFWTDSKIMLGYIANESKRFHVFVANRIREIRDHSHPSQWHYVPTEANPADLVLRGATSAELVEGPWFSGPKFLYNENPFSLGDTNPQLYTIPADDPEVKKVVLSTKAKEPSHLMLQLERFSSWQKMKRVVALCLKLRHGKDDKRSTEITATDLCAAEDTIISLVQQEAFPSEIESLRRKKAVKSSSSIAKLDPFLDHNGTLRIGGRINNGTLPYEVKHPVLLPRRSHITTALLLHVHGKTAHQGRGITTSALRNQGYWVIGASKEIASLIHNCVKCRRLRRQEQTQKMADLPNERVKPAPPFANCGMDCFGPFLIKEGRKELKCWGVLITSRAVHLEVITTMSTDGFLNTLRRSTSLRGLAQLLWCDRGTNFVGTNNELLEALKEIDDTRLHRYFLEHKVCSYSFLCNLYIHLFVYSFIYLVIHLFVGI